MKDQGKLGALKKEILVLLRSPIFWVVVWSRHLFYMQKKKKEKNKYKLHVQNTSLSLIE